MYLNEALFVLLKKGSQTFQFLRILVRACCQLVHAMIALGQSFPISGLAA